MVGWNDSPSESLAKTEEFANKALSLNDSLDAPHSLMSWIHLFKKEYDKAILSIKKAVDLNPNGADAIAHLGFINSMTGEPEKAIRNLKKAFRLNPIPSPHFYHYIGYAYY